MGKVYTVNYSDLTESTPGILRNTHLRVVSLEEVLTFLRSNPGDTRFWNECFNATAAVLEKEFQDG